MLAVAAVARPPTPALDQESNKQRLGASLLFTFESDDITLPSSSRTGNPAGVQAVKDLVSFFSSPQNSFASKLLQDVLTFRDALIREVNEVDVGLLANKLLLAGYTLHLCNSARQTTGAASAPFSNLRHEFLLVRGTGDFDSVEFIVDLSFKEQFAIPHPTAAYTDILAVVPDVFVGTTSNLMPVVQALCQEMANSFEARALTLPPWRKTSSVLSKWMPANNRNRQLISHQDGSSSMFHTNVAKSPGALTSGAMHALRLQQPSRHAFHAHHPGHMVPIRPRLPQPSLHKVTFGFAF